MDSYVFRRASGFVCALLIVSHESLLKGGAIVHAGDVVRGRLLREVWARGFRTVAAHRWQWARFFPVGPWWMPETLMVETVHDAALGALRPAALNEYLTCRYGSRRVLVTSWHLWRRDAAVRQTSPAVILGRAGPA